MGCFLTITARDFAQLDATMKEAISVVQGAQSSTVRIQVGATLEGDARHMAQQIRQYASSVQIISISPDERVIPTAERHIFTIKAFMAADEPEMAVLYQMAMARQMKSNFGSAVYSTGKEGERVAAQVLEQHQNLTIHRITKGKGVDIDASSRGGGRVVVEVKTSMSGKPFHEHLGEGYGYRQCSDDWLKKVKVDPATTTVMGVHIDPIKNTVSLYRRIDGNAESWKCLLRNAPLSEFNIDPTYTKAG